MKATVASLVLTAVTGTLSAQPPNCTPAPAGLVSWWRAEGNASDAGGSNNGTLSNGVTFVSGVAGQAFSFDGSNSYVEVPDSASLRLTDELTIEFWVKRQETNWPTDYLLNKGGDWTGGGLNYGVGVAPSGTNNLQFFFAGGNRGVGSLSDLNWHHCAIVARNGDVDPTFYIDGVALPVANREGAGTVNLYPSTQPLYIGAQVDPATGYNYFSKTLIDELSIYNRELSTSEIQALYNAGSAGKCVASTGATNCFSYPDFNSTDGLALSGGTTVLTNGVLRLTPAIGGQAGAARLQQKLPCANGFDTTFHFRITGPFGNPCGGELGGDGINFSVQNASPTNLDFSGIGGGGGTNSVNIFFNTFQNWPDCSDPQNCDVSDNSVGIAVNSVYIAQADLNPTGIDLSDGNVHQGHVIFNGIGIAVSVDNVTVLTNVTMPGLQPGVDSSGNGWVGFTAGTGCAFESHDILDWSFCTVPPTPCTPAPAGLVGWWKAEGNADDSVAGNNGTIQNAGFTTGVVGQAFAFDPDNYPYGTYTGIQIPDQPAFALTNSLSIEGWIRPRGPGYNIFYRGDNRPGLDPYSLSMQGNNLLRFYLEDEDGNTAFAETSLDYGRWYHVAATLDGGSGTVSLYTNGVLASQITTPIRPFANLIPADSPGVGIGNVNDGFNNFPFVGDIDEIALYSRALSLGEIQALYKAGRSGKCGPPFPAPFLMDIDFGGGPVPSAETGWAAIGQTTNDFWNHYTHGFEFFDVLTNLELADGTVTAAGLTVANAPGVWSNGSTDPMYADYIYPWDGGDVTVTITNLPAGQYDVLVYGSDGNYEISAGETSYGIEHTRDNPVSNPPVWTEGVQYARFTNVQVTADQPLVLTVRPGLDAYAIVSGMQIVSSSSALIEPLILMQPQDAAAGPGNAATFKVIAIGTAPLSYQWSFNETNLLAGATNASLFLSNVRPPDAGVYRVVVTNAAGSILSSNAALTVLSGVTNRLLNVDFGGGPAIDAKTGWAAIGQTTNDFWNHYTHGYEFLAALPDLELADGTVTSVGLTVANAPGVWSNGSTDPMYADYIYPWDGGNVTVTVTNLPAGPYQVLVYGSDGNFEITGGGISYGIDNTRENPVSNPPVWMEGVQYARFTNVQVTADQPLVLTARPGLDAYAIVSGMQILSLPPPPVAPSIVTQPQSQINGAGLNASFSVGASGTAPLHYQWFFNDNPIPGATKSNLTFRATSTSQSGRYSVVVTNMAGATNSDYARLLVVVETVPPMIAITSPADGVRWTNAIITVLGTASDNARVDDVQFQYNSGDFQDAMTTNQWKNWTAKFPAAPGTNLFRVQATDTSGNRSLAVTRRIFYPVPSLLTVLTNGLGSVTPNSGGKYLELGRAYTLTAGAGTGQVFAGWDQGIISTNPVLTFLMQSNLVLRANFITNPFAPVQGTYNGLFYQANGIMHETSGFLTFTLNGSGLYTARISTGGGSYPFTGGLWVDGTSTARVPRTGKTTLTISLQVDLASGTDQVAGTITDGNWIAVLSGDRLVFNGMTRIAPPAGKYTLGLLHLDEDASVPGGDGAGTASVSPGGLILFNGTLADGSLVSQSVGLSKNGQWPLYVNLYKGNGSLLGWATFTNRDTSSIEGDVSWIKMPVAGRFYPAGFVTDVEILGSHYSAPARGVRVLNITHAEMVFTGGSLSAPFTNSVFLTTNSTVTVTSGTNKLALTLNLATGLGSGSFSHPVTKSLSTIKGAVLREDNTLRGYFLSTNQSGAVILRAVSR